MVDCALKALTLLPVIVFLLSGCTGLLTGAAVGTTVLDRYEKHQLEKRIETLEKELTRRCKCTM
jgi:hypothetical protein